MLKKPKQKDAIDFVKSFAALKVGGMASRGVVSITPMEDTTTKKLIVAGAGIVIALAYNGPAKKEVQALGLGMALEQGGSLLDEQIQKVDPVKADPTSKVSQALRATYGLNGCGCGDHAMMNGIEAIQWDRPFLPAQEYTPYEEVNAPLGV